MMVFFIIEQNLEVCLSKEKFNTLYTWDGFIGIEKLTELFELLKKSQIDNLNNDELLISKSRKKLTIEAQNKA